MERDTELRAGEIIKKYRTHKYISCGIVALDIVFLVYMLIFKMDYRINYIIGGFASLLLTVSVFALYAVIGAIAVLVKWLGAMKIHLALYEECDPFVYESCLNKLHPFFYKERFACLRAIARYYQGDFYGAEEILRNVNLYKLKGMYKVNYYIIMSSVFFKKGEGMRVTELEKSYRAGMKKNNKKEQMYFRMLCACNNMYRAMENKDYPSAFRFLAERKELEEGKTRKWALIGFHMWEARICAGLGDKESAGLHLDHVIADGGRLVYVAEARELLGKINGAEDGESENG